MGNLYTWFGILVAHKYTPLLNIIKSILLPIIKVKKYDIMSLSMDEWCTTI